MRKLLIILSIIVANTLIAQQYDNIWPMGADADLKPIEKDTFNNHFIMDFSDDTLSVQKKLEFKGTIYSESSALSDSLGNLLMYSNGCNIYGADGEILTNGDSINHIIDSGPSVWLNFCGVGGYPTGKSMVFIPFFSQHRVFVLHVTVSFKIGLPISSQYLLFDQIEKINSEWVVVKKNQILVDDDGGKFDVTKHANGRDWWIVSHRFFKHDYRIWLMTPDGIELRSEQSFANQIPGAPAANPSFSPKGDKFLYHNPRNSSWFFDFDRCTGSLSNPIEFKLPYCQESIEGTFSPNGRFLYITDRFLLFQIDMWNPDTLTNRDTLAVWDGLIWPTPPIAGPTNYLSMQTGPDGKIYIAPVWSAKLFHVIERPNELGKACQFRERVYRFPFYSQGCVPNFPYYRLGPIDGSSCDTLGLNNEPLANFRYYPDTFNMKSIEFIDNSSYEPMEWFWTFGDGGTSTEVNPNYTYLKGGVYEVCETVSNSYGSDTYCRKVSIGTVSTEEDNSSDGIDIFPNPTSGQFSIQLKPFQRVSGIKIRDIQGRIVDVQQLSVSTNLNGEFDLSGLSSGIYLLEIEINGHKVFKKVLKI